MSKTRKSEREGEEIEKERRRGCVTSAITSSEMHLDRVSICQNKAASTAASLMALDVSDRGGGETGGRGARTLKENAAACVCVNPHPVSMDTDTTAVNHLFFFFCLFVCSQTPPIIDTKFLPSFSVIVIELFSRLGVCVYASAVPACLPSNSVFGCQILSTISHCDELGVVSITHLN